MHGQRKIDHYIWNDIYQNKGRFVFILQNIFFFKMHEPIVYFLQWIHQIIDTLYFDIYKSNSRNNAIGGLVRMDLSYLCNLRECRISTIATVNCGLFYMIKTILIKDIARFILNILFSTLIIIFLLNIIYRAII